MKFPPVCKMHANMQISIHFISKRPRLKKESVHHSFKSIFYLQHDAFHVLPDLDGEVGDREERRGVKVEVVAVVVEE